MLKDILASLIMGAGGFSKSYGEGLQSRNKTRDEYMNDLNQLYVKQMLDQNDPMRQVDMDYKKALTHRALNPVGDGGGLSEYQKMQMRQVDMDYKKALTQRVLNPIDDGLSEYQKMQMKIGAGEKRGVDVDFTQIYPTENENGLDINDITKQFMELDPEITKDMASGFANEYINARSKMGRFTNRNLEDVMRTKRQVFVPTGKARELQMFLDGENPPTKPPLFLDGENPPTKPPLFLDGENPLTKPPLFLDGENPLTNSPLTNSPMPSIAHNDSIEDNYIELRNKSAARNDSIEDNYIELRNKTDKQEFKTPEEVKSAIKNGLITKDDGINILVNQFGYAL